MDKTFLSLLLGAGIVNNDPKGVGKSLRSADAIRMRGDVSARPALVAGRFVMSDQQPLSEDSCPRMTAEERYAAGFRMIHPIEGRVRCAIGLTLGAYGAYSARNSTAPVSWPDLTLSAGVMLWNMGRQSQ